MEDHIIEKLAGVLNITQEKTLFTVAFNIADIPWKRYR